MKKFTSYIAGVITGMIIISAPIFADSYTRSIEALVNFTTVKINGVKVESDNFIVDGKTYVWIRDVANMFGKEIDWDQETNTADIVDEIRVIEVVATVNDTVVSTEDVNLAMSSNPEGTTYEEIIKNAVDYEIDNAVAFNEAVKNGYGMTNEIKSSAQSYINQLKGYYGDSFNSLLASNGLNEKTYTAFIEKSMLLENFTASLKDSMNFTEEETLAKYDELKEHFESATAKHILISTSEKSDDEANKEIEKIFKELKSVDDFDKLMAEYSEDEGSKNNLDGMTFGRGQMVSEFEEAAFTQEIGVIGKPIKTKFGYHIVLVTDRSVSSLEEVKDFCEHELFMDWYKNQIKQWREASNIIINEEIMNNLINQY